jgi:peptide/nickel transport system permease protein
MKPVVSPLWIVALKGLAILRSLVSNWQITLGSFLILCLVLLSVFGPLFVASDAMEMGAAGFTKPPSPDHVLGTDPSGRDMLAVVIYGTPITLEIGLIAGGFSTLVGIALGLLTGYRGGWIDTVFRSVADVMLTIPSMAILIVVASYVHEMTVLLMGATIALFSWPGTTRSIRAQVLSMRESGFVRLARLSGESDLEIIFKEIMPNLLPYIAAGFVGAVSGSILASVGLELLGLGFLSTPSLAFILHEAFVGAAMLRELYWFWAPPVVLLIVLFLGLFFISLGLDQRANPRLKGARH